MKSTRWSMESSYARGFLNSPRPLQLVFSDALFGCSPPLFAAYKTCVDYALNLFLVCKDKCLEMPLRQISHLIWSGLIGLLCISFCGHGFAVTTLSFASDNPKELARTWSESRVYIPGISGQTHTSLNSLPVDFREGKEGQFPLIIYLHGCNGFWWGTAQRARFFTQLGFAVIAPDSFARHVKPISCVPSKKKGGLHRGVLLLRQAEAIFSLSRARLLPWVDKNVIILFGFSEGGITVATLSPTQASGVHARIIEGWGCHAGWPEYVGINAPAWQAVLTMVANNDPWFRRPKLQGHCGKFLKNNESRSVVYKNPPLSTSHGLLDYEVPRQEVVKFLSEIQSKP